MNSIMKVCKGLKFSMGMVFLKIDFRKEEFRMIAANKAPANCANKYGPTLFNLNLLTTKKPIVTAGLRCAPEISPKAYIILITISPKL